MFNNLLKAEIMNVGKFKLVHGSDITKYYNEDNYFKLNGSLGNSCMRHEDCNEFFKIYEDVASLLICIKDDLIVGRAIIWNIDNYTLMDRIYVCDDYLEEYFINYARDQKWAIRFHNKLTNNGDVVYWYLPFDNYESQHRLNLSIKLNKHYEYFPYIDSFRYYDAETNMISLNPDIGNCVADQTDGDLNLVSIRTCAQCGRKFKEWYEDDDDHIHYSDYLNTYLCCDCSYYHDDLCDYVPNDADTVLVYNSEDDEIPYPKEYVQNNTIDINTYSPCNNKFVYYDGKYYYMECFYWNLEENKYKFLEENKNED